MKYSIIFTTIRKFEDIKPIFKVSNKNAELIIVDPNYNEETKREIQNVEHDFLQVSYVPKWDDFSIIEYKFSVIKYKKDRIRCHNTGFAYCEGEYIIKLDDCTELCPDFFDRLDDDIRQLEASIPDKNFVIRPIKLEGWMGHTKWNNPPYLNNIKDRYVVLDRNGIGNTMCVTLDQFIASRKSIDKLNGNDERYDVGHGFEDADIFQRFITSGCSILLDTDLKTFQTGHIRSIDPIPFNEWIYDIELIEILNGRYKAYNGYNISELRKQLLKNKEKYKISKNNVDNYINISHTPHKHTPYKHKTYPFDQYFKADELTTNVDRINKLKDKHKGEDLFILGNSPDITKEFIEKIRGRTTFASNGFAVMKDVWNYEPSYMVVTNQGTFDNHLRNMKPEFRQYEGMSVSELFQEMKCPFIVSDLIVKPLFVNAPHMRTQERIDFLKKHVHIKVLNKEEIEPPHMLMTPPESSDICFDLIKGTWMCGTVITDLMIPLAVWMGFTNIYLKGCSGGGGHFYDTSPRHFWNTEKQKEIYERYGMFKELLGQKDCNIFNLDSPMNDSYREAMDCDTKKQFNPTLSDGHKWDGQPYSTCKILGKEPYIIEYKNIDEVI